jgi:DnaJ-class molecular chaperone
MSEKKFDEWEKDDPDLRRARTCSKCNGLGFKIVKGEEVPCTSCNGEGTVLV